MYTTMPGFCGARDGTQGFPVAGQTLHTPRSAVIPDPWIVLGLLRWSLTL